MIVRKRILKSLLLLSAILFMSCAPKQNSTQNQTHTRETLNLRITWKDYSGRGEAIKRIVDSYNGQSNGNYVISVVGGDEELAVTQGLLEKNDATVFVLPYRFVKYFGDNGYLCDITAQFQKEKDLFYPKLWELGTANGKTYGVPWLGHTIGLIYNKNLLEKAGVKPASIKSLDALLNAIEKVEANTEAKGIGLVGANHNDVSWMVNQFIYGFGSSLVNEEGTKVAVNNEKSKAALDFYKNVLGKHAQSTWKNDTGVEVMNSFLNQQIAFEFQGIWGVTDIEKNGNPFEVGIIPLADLGLNAEVGPLMLSLPKGMQGEQKEEALKLIQFLISKEAQEKVMDGEYSPEHDAYYPFRVPARKDLSDSLVFEKYPQYLPFLLGFEKPSIDVPVPKWAAIKELYYAPLLHQLMTDRLSIDAFLETIESKGNEVLQGR